MNYERKKKILKLLRVIPPCVCITLIILYFIYGRDISAEQILQNTPKRTGLAIAFFVLLYSIKSLSVFFPLLVLHITSGILFPPSIAFLTNLLGTAATLTIPYCIGRFSGTDFITLLTKKFPKIFEIIDLQYKNMLFLSFFLRVISCLPGDIVSIYLGMIKIPFPKYILGSVLGTLPGIITSTLIGATIDDPSSPAFIIAIVLTVSISICSFVLYTAWKKKK